MLIDRFLGHDRRLAAADALAEVGRLDFTGDAAPALLAFSPVSRGNPFQALLNSRLPKVGIHAVPAYDIATTRTIATALRGPSPDVIAHLHWLNVVMQSADDQAHASRLQAAFLDDLDHVKDAGGRIVWTVHNVLPHDARFPDLELELRKAVIERADLVHVMSPRTRDLVEPLFPLPADRTFQVPHPSYAGVYPSTATRSSARAQLGLSDHAVVFVLFGRIAPYKGVTELVAAFDELARERPGEVALVLAGNPVQDPETTALEEVVTAHPSIHGAFRKITDGQVQTFLRAADVMALPYRKSLNSGALNLALTFGLPVVLPRSSGEVSGTDASWAQVYDDDRPEALLDALRIAADRLVTDDARRAATSAADQVPPDVVGDAFATTLRTWLDTGAIPQDRRA